MAQVARLMAVAATVLLVVLAWGFTLEHAPAATIPETALVGLLLGIITLIGMALLLVLWPSRRA